MNFYRTNIKNNDYVIATYDIKTKDADLKKASWELAIGQSVGNPHERSQWETDELFEKHSCIILHEQKELEGKTQGIVKVAFPVCNIDWNGDGITQLLCQLMGGQMDIKSFDSCRLIDIDIPNSVRNKYFLGPAHGISGLRDYTQQFESPLSGAIIKPKIGLGPDTLLEVVKDLYEGGVDFIKEDEIMSNPAFCSIEERVPVVMNWLNKQKRKVVYAVCITGDHDHILKRAWQVEALGGNAIHINHWAGLGVYNAVRKLNTGLFIHFQKSGDRVFTDPRHNFGIDWNVICKIATMIGVDTIHIGTLNGYSNDTESEAKTAFKTVTQGNTMPTLSCGMHPGLVHSTIGKVGADFIANVGGAIHSHPGGTLAGAKAMRQALDDTPGPEFRQAVNKWGIQ